MTRKILLLFIVIVNLPIYSIIQNKEVKVDPSPKKAKEKPRPKPKLECCEINQGKSDEVEIISICQQKNSTIINIKALISGNFCAATYSISMDDDKGKTYQTIAIHGIPACPQRQKVETGYVFSFEFEKIEKRVISISLQEDTSVLPGIPYGIGWKWSDVNISHCKL